MPQNELFSRKESKFWYESIVRPIVPEWIHSTAQNLVFALINPDAVYRQLVSPIIDIFLENSLSVVSIKVIEHAEKHQLEDLYRFNILRHNRWHNNVVWWMNQQVFMEGPLLIIHLTSASKPNNLFEIVNELKERVRVEKRATNRNLALLHAADSWLDSTRESFIFVNPSEWLSSVAAAWAICKNKLESWKPNEVSNLQIALNYPVTSLQLEDVCEVVRLRLSVWYRNYALQEWKAPDLTQTEFISASEIKVLEACHSALLPIVNDTKWTTFTSRTETKNAIIEMQEITSSWPPVGLASLKRFEELCPKIGFQLRNWEKLVLLTSTCYGGKYLSSN